MRKAKPVILSDSDRATLERWTRSRTLPARQVERARILLLATESAFLAVLCTFNLLSLYQHQTTPESPYRQPGTLRGAVFLCGAVLGVMGREVVVKLSAAWGGLSKHKPLVEATLNWLNVASPKSIPPEDRLAIGGGTI